MKSENLTAIPQHKINGNGYQNYDGSSVPSKENEYSSAAENVIAKYESDASAVAAQSSDNKISPPVSEQYSESYLDRILPALNIGDMRMRHINSIQ